MPSLSYKEQFIMPVKSGRKKHTIRAKRKKPIKVGDTLYMFYGMRTKYCTRIGQAVCTKVEQITIYQNGLCYVNGKRLTLRDRDDLAYRDGFENYFEMLGFWIDNNTLPFKGDIIHWQEFFPHQQ